MKSLQRAWHRHSPQLFLGELLEKRWMEPIIPFTLTIAVFLAFAIMIPRYLTAGSLQELMRNFAEQGMVAVAMAFSVLSGGIDLSVGAVFAMSNFLALYLYLILGLPLPVTIVLVVLFGAAMGAINGGLIAYGKTRPFLTTLVVLIIVRAAYNKVTVAFTNELASIDSGSSTWDFMGSGRVLGIPFNMLVLILLAVGTHFFLTRIKPGVHIMAVGSSR
ncbi:ABC transporter permease, partial [Bradyrhizobium elkanii]|nr:ABC transporter permease [Bradyrhizobium elkanii]